MASRINYQKPHRDRPIPMPGQRYPERRWVVSEAAMHSVAFSSWPALYPAQPDHQEFLADSAGIAGVPKKTEDCG